MKKIPAAKFKEQGLAILDKIDPAGIVITKHGKPVAQLFPIKEENGSPKIGCLKGKIKIHGAIISTGVKWDAES